MLFFVSDNPTADAAKLDTEQTKRAAKLPVCAECGGHIQGEIYYEINGAAVCEECLELYHRKWTEDYVV